MLTYTFSNHLSQLDLAIASVSSNLDCSSSTEDGQWDVFEMSLPVMPKDLLDSRRDHQGALGARAIDHSEKKSITTQVRRHYSDGTIEAKVGRKWLPVDYYYCALNPNPCVYA